jgi:hypothetical protein
MTTIGSVGRVGGGLFRPASFSGPPSLAASGPERSPRRDWPWYGPDTKSRWPAETGRAPVSTTPSPAGSRLERGGGVSPLATLPDHIPDIREHVDLVGLVERYTGQHGLRDGARLCWACPHPDHADTEQKWVCLVCTEATTAAAAWFQARQEVA